MNHLSLRGAGSLSQPFQLQSTEAQGRLL